MIRNNQVLKNILTLMGGTSLAQLVPIILSPFLTRLYSPADFAEQTIFLSLLSIFGMIITGRLELAIFSAPAKGKIRELVVVAMLLNGAISLILILFTFIFAKTVEKLLSIPLSIIELSIIGIFLGGIFQVQQSLVNYLKDYKSLVRVNIYRAILNGALMILFGLSAFNSGAMLIVSTLASLFFGNIFLFYIVLKRFFSVKKLFKTKGIVTTFLDFKHYTLFNAPTALLDMLAVQFIIFCIGYFYGHEVLGFYSLTQRILLLPISLIASSTSRVLLEHFSSAIREGKLIKPVFLRSARSLLFTGLPIIFLLLIFGPEIFKLFFGGAWEQSGEFARVIAPIFLFRLLGSTLSIIFAASGNIRVGSLWQLFYFVTTFLVLIIACNTLSFIGMLWVYMLHEVIQYGVYFYLSYREVCRIDALGGSK